MKVPYIDLTAQNAPIRDALLEAVARVLDHGMFINGPEVSQFEDRFATLCNTRYAVGVSNGTSALVLVLRGLGIGPGDEVITAPNSFLASASAIALAGAKPVFADVRDDYNIDPSEVETAITPRTRAVIAVHLTGRPADMGALMSLCESRRIALIEDAAQAVGARYDERPVGGLGTAGCFSLHPLKNLSAVGDAGIVSTNDQSLAEYLRKARNHGLRSRDECEFFAPNERLDTIHAAVLLVKMDHLKSITDKRRAHAAHYQRRLNGLPEIRVPVDRPHEYAVYHTFVIQAERRDMLQAFLAERGIDTKIHYPIPIHRQPAFGVLDSRFHNTDRLSQKILSLPIHEALASEAIDYVCDAICEFAAKDG